MTDDVELRGGPDDQMREDFRTVVQATAASGAPRHGAGALRRLAQVLTGAGPIAGHGGIPARDSALFELCHLVRAVEEVGGSELRWLFFLGQERVRSEACRALLDASATGDIACGGTVSLTPQAVSLHYGRDSFSVTFARMPVLIALFEFLASMDAGQHMPALLETLDDMVGSPPQRRQIQDASNRLASLLRSYLNRHLATAGDDAFAGICRFLQQRSDGGHWRVDDDAVLVFWQQENLHDFRTYEKAFRRFVDLLAALAAADRSQAAARARRLGIDRTQGEVDPEDLPYELDAYGAWQSPLADLEAPPAAAIKFFTGTEQRRLGPLATYGPDAVQLPLAFLRLDVFGAQQTLISQALRRHQAGSLQDLFACDEAEPYEARRNGFAALRAHLAKLQLAALHAIRSARNDAGAPTDREAEVHDRGARAFREIKRRGFEAGPGGPATHADGFEAAAGALTRLGSILDGYLDALRRFEHGSGPLRDRFLSDRRIFAAEFRKIYGETHG